MIMNKLKQTGFTLLELILVVAMIGIVSAVGLPAMKSMMVTNELVNTANQMRMSMKLARSEAVIRGKNAVMCSSSDGETCSNSNGEWKHGWIVYVDIDNDNTLDSGELRWVEELDSGSQITVTPTDAAFDKQLMYSFNGWLLDGDDIGFDICSGYSSNGYPQREIRASIAGDPTLTKNLAKKC